MPTQVWQKEMQPSHQAAAQADTRVPAMRAGLPRDSQVHLDSNPRDGVRWVIDSSWAAVTFW